MIYPSEDSEQEQFVSWFRIEYPNLIIFSVPNGGSRNKLEGAKLKKTGLLAGIPDLIVLFPNKTIVFIEMKKRVGGKLTPSQKKIFPLLRLFGFEILICEGAEMARNKFMEYYETI